MMRLAAALALLLAAAPQDKSKKRPSMDYGPFLSASYILKPGAKVDNATGNFDGDVVARGIAIRLADDWSEGIIFDTDTMRVAAGWTGAPLRFTGVIFDGAHGPSPTLGAPPAFHASAGPGWAKDGSFEDPRPDSIPPLPRPGPLPSAWAKYRGLYLHGSRVILSYTVGACPVLESFSREGTAFARSLTLGPSEGPLEVLLATEPADLQAVGIGLPEGAEIKRVDGRLLLRLPRLTFRVSFKVLLAPEGIAAPSPPEDLDPLTRGGPARWNPPVVTQGKVAREPAPYVVDVLALPEKNSWNARMRVGGLDFFADGTRAALCTWDGDVWIVSGIDDTLVKLEWKRFATGLHQPLGLKIVDEVIYTVGHDQMTRLRDLDRDGEADFYENFNNDWELTTAFHSFCFDLQTDPAGNFLFAFNSPVRSGGGGFHRITRHHGCILRVSKDGRKLDVYATGFRANNGIGVSPSGQVTSGDNEGSWVPKCPLHWVEEGSFNGVVDSAHRPMKSAKGKPDPEEQPRPLCWMPKNVDNSGGGQVWVTSDRWGPFQGELLHMSYGTSSLYKVLKEEVGGRIQGGVSRFPLRFTSSAMRARFNPRDGQLYVAGLRGWQSNAAREGGLDRVRFTGAPVHMPTALRATAKGLQVTFTSPLDASAADPDKWSVEAWNYRWTAGYGSGDFSPRAGAAEDKGVRGKEHDALGVASAKISPDGRTVSIEIPGIKPVMQMRVAWRLKAADGTPLQGEIHNTIHALGSESR